MGQKDPCCPKVSKNAEWTQVQRQHTTIAKKVELVIGYGVALAIAISWSVHHSLLWAIVHGLFGWAYVVAYAIGIAERGSW